MTLTQDQIDAIRAQALNSDVRALSGGCTLTWDEADELGAAAVEWLWRSLGLEFSTDDSGVTLAVRS